MGLEVETLNRETEALNRETLREWAEFAKSAADELEDIRDQKYEECKKLKEPFPKDSECEALRQRHAEQLQRSEGSPKGGG